MPGPARAAAIACALALVVRTGGAAAGSGRDRAGNAPLAAGEGWVALVYELSLSTRLAGEPWALAVDAAIALSPRLTLGVAQSAGALATVDRSGGLCLDSGAHACPRAYRGGAIDARWRLTDGRARVSAIARAGLAGVSPLLPYARLGVRGDGARGRTWIALQLELTLSLGGRDVGNRDTLEAPLWLGVDLGPASAWLRAGARGDLAELGEKLEIPIAAGVAIGGRRWRAGVEAGWPQLLGPQNSWKQRQAAIWIAVER